MKVATLTFHKAINYGAYFQALALQHALRSLGHDPILIDYENKKFRLANINHLFRRKNPRVWIANIRRFQKFRQAWKEFAISRKVLGAEQMPDSDVLVLGSDEIWNYQDHAHGIDLTYFGELGQSGKVCAYAPSIGELDINKIPPSKLVIGALQKLDTITVRDYNTRNLVTKTNRLSAPLVLDPVLIGSFATEHCKPGPRLKKYPYLMVYGPIREQDSIEKARKFASRNGLQTLSVGYRNRWCDLHDLQSGPWEFLSIIRDSEAVLTSSFHATLFSIVFGKKLLISRRVGRWNKFSYILALLPDLELANANNSSADFISIEKTRPFVESCQQSFRYLKEML